MDRGDFESEHVPVVVGIAEWTPPEDNLRLRIEKGVHGCTRHEAEEKHKGNCWA
jgi:hypothetical protein